MFKRIILIVILLSIALPLLIKYILQDSNPEKLSGDYVSAEPAVLNAQNWWNGSYNDMKTKWLNENFGRRNLLVRCINQIRFSLFRQSTNADFILGKDNYLYQRGYVIEYTGEWYKGKEGIEDTISRLKQLESKLKTLGKELLVVLAPSKARVYPEFLPEKYQKMAVESNYSSYKEMLGKYNIHHIDVNQWFLQKKESSRFALFPKLGVHWSKLETIYIFDSLNRHLSNLTKSDFPQLEITKMDSSNTLQPPDDDAINLQNLLVEIQHPTMCYPGVRVIDAYKASKNILTISDSYWWDAYGREIPLYSFKNNEFWYYNSSAYSNKWNGSKKVKEMDIARHILQSDVVIIVCAESNLGNFGFGFITNALKALENPPQATEQEIVDYIKTIKEDSTWFNGLKKEAEKNKKRIEQTLLDNANYMFGLKGPIIIQQTIEKTIEQIKADPSWLASIHEKAKNRNQSVEQILKEDAEFIVNKASSKRKHLLPLYYWITAIKADSVWLKDVKQKADKAGISIETQLLEEAKYLKTRPIELPI
jgi:hypothetical protein